MQQQVPLCLEHLQFAEKKSRSQKFIEWLGKIGGVSLGFAAAASLSYYWISSEQGHPIWTIPLALAVGASLGFTWWASLTFWMAHHFASRQTKLVFQSVNMVRYDPYRPLLEVTFSNETFAELTARQNLNLLDIDRTGLSQYHLNAVIHSDDIRLNGSLETDILLDHRPSDAEARELIEPVAHAAMLRNLGEGCFFEINVTAITEI